MRRMYSESELRAFIKKYVRENGDDVVASLVGKDIVVDDISATGTVTVTGGVYANFLRSASDFITNGNLTASGNIVGKTLEQTQANWELDISDITFGYPSGITTDVKYGVMKLINGCLHIICEVDVSNPTENAISLNIPIATSYIDSSKIPDYIKEKVITFNGVSWKNSTGYDAITSGLAVFTESVAGATNYSSVPIAMTYALYAGSLRLTFNSVNVSLGAGATRHLSFRIELDLI